MTSSLPITDHRSQITSSAAKRQEIYLYDSIGGFGDGAKSVIDQIQAAKNSPIDLHINSPGGGVFDGYAIYNSLLNHKPGVTVYIDGLAASIASYIAMAGNPIVMAANALIMVHNPSSFVDGGTAEEMRKQADLLDKITDSIVDAYSRRTGLPVTQISEMLDQETWLDAETAKAFGFVDQITEPLELAASFDKTQLSKFKNAPEQLKKLMNEPQNICCQPTEGQEQPQGPSSPIPNPAPEPAPAPPSLPEQPENKLSLFQRVAAIIKEKGTLAEINAKHQSEIEAKDKQNAEFGMRNAELTNALAASQAQVKTYEAAEKELKEALEQSNKENKSVTDGVTAQVAAIGFDQTKLPPSVDAEKAQAAREAAAPKSAQQWGDEYNRITDPAERTIFFRQNKQAILKANADLKKSEK